MAFPDKTETKSTPFDDVDLFEAENRCTFHSSSDVNNAVAEQNDEVYMQKDDVIESAASVSVYSKSNTDFLNHLETDQLEDKTNAVAAEICTLSTEIDKCGDDIDAYSDHLAITASHTSASGHHSASLSPEVVNFNTKTLPSTYAASDGGSLETSTAVLTLDSDVDSPQRPKTYCDLDSGDGMEVDVAALQLQLTQLTAERDNYKLLYSQSKEENDNYQEQILEVWLLVYTIQ